MQKILSVLQKTECAATEIQPMDNITETTTDITLNPSVSTDYAENPEPVLQKTEYAAVEKYIFFLWVRIDASFFFECGVSSLFYACLFFIFKWVFFLHSR